VGVVGAILVIGTLAVFLLRRGRSTSTEITEISGDQAWYVIKTLETEQALELDAPRAAQEMDGNHQPRELP
jgi:hypothetical protein